MSRKGTWLTAAATRRVVRGRRERVAAAHRGAEGRHALGVDARQRPGEGDRRPPVLELALRLEQVRLAAAVAEAAVVEDERRDARRREALGEGPEPVAPRPREPVRHDHDRRLRRVARGGIEPGGAGVCARLEFEVFSVHGHSTPRPAGM